MNFAEKILGSGYKRVVEDWAKNQLFNPNNGKILAKGGICSTTVDSSTNDG